MVEKGWILKNDDNKIKWTKERKEKKETMKEKKKKKIKKQKLKPNYKIPKIP